MDYKTNSGYTIRGYSSDNSNQNSIYSPSTNSKKGGVCTCLGTGVCRGTCRG
jgi:hypothetical protein